MTDSVKAGKRAVPLTYGKANEGQSKASKSRFFTFSVLKAGARIENLPTAWPVKITRLPQSKISVKKSSLT
jgi:hypothetical protein